MFLTFKNNNNLYLIYYKYFILNYQFILLKNNKINFNDYYNNYNSIYINLIIINNILNNT